MTIENTGKPPNSYKKIVIRYISFNYYFSCEEFWRQGAYSLYIFVVSGLKKVNVKDVKNVRKTFRILEKAHAYFQTILKGP